MKQKDAEEDGNDRVDVGVGGHLGDGDVLQEVGVGRKADDGTEDGKIGDGAEAGAVPDGGSPASAGEREDGVEDGGGTELPGGGYDHIQGEVEPARKSGADGEGEGGERKDAEGGEVAGAGWTGALKGGPKERNHADGAEEDAGPAAAIEAFPAGEDDLKERQHKRHGGDDEGGEAACDHGLGPGEKDVVDAHEEDADDGETPGLGGGDAKRLAGGEADGKEEEGGQDGAEGADQGCA